MERETTRVVGIRHNGHGTSQPRHGRNLNVPMPKLSRDFILPVVAAVLGTMAILGLLLCAIFMCTRPRRESSAAASASQGVKSKSLKRPKGVVQRDTSSIVSATESVPVPFAPAFRRTQSDAQSSIFENFGRTSHTVKSYGADDEYDDVWSYAMTEDESGLMMNGSHMSRVNSSASDDETEQGIEVPHTVATPVDLTIPNMFARTNTGRSLYEV